jgi:hypothetical protein
VVLVVGLTVWLRVVLVETVPMDVAVVEAAVVLPLVLAVTAVMVS